MFDPYIQGSTPNNSPKLMTEVVGSGIRESTETFTLQARKHESPPKHMSILYAFPHF